MKKMKRLLALVLAMAMAMSMAITTSFATDGVAKTLSIGDNEVELAANDTSNVSWTYTAEAAGTLTVQVTKLSKYDEYSGEWKDGTEYLDYAATWSQYTMTLNGENGWSRTQSIQVNAGDVVTVEFYNNMYNAVKATITLSLEATASNVLTVSGAAEMGASMDHNTYTEDKYYVTGVITSVIIDKSSNCSMYIEDENGNSLYVYRTYSADGETKYAEMENKPVFGDTVTVYGVIGNYNGAQMKNAWITEYVSGSGIAQADPDADSVLTVAEAIALGKTKDHNNYTEGKYYVTGKITEVYNEEYGNMYITDGNGNTLTIYGTYDADGTTKYGKMENPPKAGDTVTVYGVIGKFYNGSQMKNGWFKSAPVTVTALSDGDNNIEIAADSITTSYTYTATQTGTLYFTVTAFNYTNQWGTTDMSDYLASYFDPTDNVWVELDVNGTALANNYYGSVDVVAGDVVNVEWKIITENEYVVAWEMGATLNLNYEGYDIPTPGSAEAPIELDVYDWNLEFPVDSVEIAAGESAHYELLNFNGYNFTVTGENVAVKVAYESLEGTTYKTYESVNGVVTVPAHTWQFPIEIINNGNVAATYELNYAALELTDGAIVLDTSAYGGGARYTWTADCDGKLTIKVDTEETGEIWMVNVYSDDNSIYQGINSFALASGGATEIVIDATKGLVLTVQIMDPYNCGVVAVDVSSEYPHSADVNEDCYCDVCGLEIHDIVHKVATAPTCEEFGNVEHWYCASCGATWLDEACTQVSNQMSVKLAPEHNLEYVAPKAPTCLDKGNLEYWYCTECGYAWLDEYCRQNTNLLAVILPEVDHTIVHVEAKDATCAENGNIEYWYCSVCGFAWLDEACTLNTNLKSVITPAVDHSYGSDGKCTVCGAVNNDSPKTGDTAPVAAMAALAVLAAGAFIVLTKKRRA